MDDKYSRVRIRNEISFKLFTNRTTGSKNSSYPIEDTANVPIWITNTGLERQQTSLTYSELADEVTSTLDEGGQYGGPSATEGQNIGFEIIALSAQKTRIWKRRLRTGAERIARNRWRNGHLDRPRPHTRPVFFQSL